MACGNGIDYKVMMTLREISRYWSLMLDIYIFWRIDIISELVKKKEDLDATIKHGQLNGIDRDGKEERRETEAHRHTHIHTYTIEYCGTT